jgi:hypothetical protein
LGHAVTARVYGAYVVRSINLARDYREEDSIPVGVDVN